MHCGASPNVKPASTSTWSQSNPGKTSAQVQLYKHQPAQDPVDRQSNLPYALPPAITLSQACAAAWESPSVITTPRHSIVTLSFRLLISPSSSSVKFAFQLLELNGLRSRMRGGSQLRSKQLTITIQMEWEESEPHYTRVQN